MAYLLRRINELAHTSPMRFIEYCEEEYASHVRMAADKICDNLDKSPIVLLSGPSGSGKTTTAHKIEEELERRGHNTHTISMDDYFKTIDMRRAPRTPDGNIDFESPDLLDMELLGEHFKALAAGKEILVPCFIFSRQKRSASRFTPVRLGEGEIAIFEGIHALNSDMTAEYPEAFKLYISASGAVEDDDGQTVFTGPWARLLRRVVRDDNFRGADAEMTLSMWGNVLRGEQLYIDPYVSSADYKFDTFLAYEVCVLRRYALPLLRAVDHEKFEELGLGSILSACERFEDIDGALVDQQSMLREFIGGIAHKHINNTCK